MTNLPDVENPRLLREVVIGLRRLHWPQSVAWLEAHLHTSEPVLDHAAMQLLRQAEDRAAVLSLLDTHSDGNADALHLRVLALQALAEEHNPLVVAGLLTRLKSDPDPARRSEYADLLCRACRRRAPWTYWGFRPAPRPANPVDWEQTAAITAAVNAALRDRDLSARATILARMLRENVTIETARLQQWLLEDHGPERVALLLDALERQPANESRAILEQIVLYTAHSAPNRLRALKSYLGQLSDADKSQLAGLAEHVEDGPVLAALLPSVDVDAFLLSRLESPSAEVRAVAVTVLAERSNRAVGERIPTLLDDADLSVICAAANAAAKLKTSACADRLLALADHSDPAICAAALRAMSAIGDSRAVEPALRALGRSATVVDALDCLGRFGGPAQLSPLLKATAGDPDVAMLSAAIRALSAWQSKQNPDVPTWSELEEQIARIQGRSGLPQRWRTMRPMVPSAAEDLVEQWRRLSNAGIEPATFNRSQIAFAEGPDATVRVSGSTDAVQPVVAVSSIFAADPGDLELSIGSRHGLRLWWNGDLVFDHPETAADARPPERIKVRSRAGFNHVVVAASGAPELTWTLWLRSIGSKAEHERLTQLVLDSRGDTLRGSEVFRNIEQSLCLKCHRLNGTGAKIGPDLTGVGSRFSRIHLVESILTPSRSIAPSYEPVAVLLTDGQVMTGVRVSETSELLAIGDTKGVIHEIPHDQIDELQVQTQSIMPEGLEQRLTPQQLVDLVSFLESQKQATP
ncbi:MAG: c-type cytochrome [Planctomycetaceae bacterium]